MGIVVVDACSLLHAKQLRTDDGGPAMVLELLAGAGVRFATSTGVHGEQVDMSLSGMLERWASEGWFETHSVRNSECKPIRNEQERHRGMKIPGKRDIAAIALARRLDAVFLTHDRPAAELASVCRVITVDLLDVAAFAQRRDLVGWSDIEASFAKLDQFAWKPDDWSRSVESTATSRPIHDRLMARLDTWHPHDA